MFKTGLLETITLQAVCLCLCLSSFLACTGALKTQAQCLKKRHCCSLSLFITLTHTHTFLPLLYFMIPSFISSYRNLSEAIFSHYFLVPPKKRMKERNIEKKKGEKNHLDQKCSGLSQESHDEKSLELSYLTSDTCPLMCDNSFQTSLSSGPAPEHPHLSHPLFLSFFLN